MKPPYRITRIAQCNELCHEAAIGGYDGTYNGPLIAIAGAVAGAATGVGMLGTTMFGVAGLGSLVGGALIAGSVMTGLGAITGNKKLSRIGSVLGIIGGVAGFASGAMTAAGNAAAAGQEFGVLDAVKAGSQSLSDAFTKGMGDIGKAFGVTDVGGSSVGSDIATSGKDVAAAEKIGGDSALTAELSGGDGYFNPSFGKDAFDSAMPESLQNLAADASNLSPQMPKGGGDTGILGFLKSPGGGRIAGGILQGVGGALGGDPQADAYNRRLDMEQAGLNRLNSQVVLIDPSDPNKNAKIVQAAQNGQQAVIAGVNPNARVGQPGILFSPNFSATNFRG